MKKWQILAPLALAAGAATALVLTRKPAAKPAKSAPPAAATKTPAAKESPAKPPKALKTGSYSFISGYKDAATVELTLSYDPEKFSYAVVEEEFLSYSSDSHVAILWGDDFNLQIEYAAFYSGEDFSAHCKSLSEKYPSFGPVRYGSVEGVKFIDGDNVCLCFPIPEDKDSYVLVTLIKGKDDDEELADLPGNPAVTELLSTLRFSRQ